MKNNAVWNKIQGGGRGVRAMLWAVLLMVGASATGWAQYTEEKWPTDLLAKYPFGTVLERDPDNPAFPYPILVADTRTDGYWGHQVSQHIKIGETVHRYSYFVFINGLAQRGPSYPSMPWSGYLVDFTRGGATGSPETTLGMLLCGRIGEFSPDMAQYAGNGWIKIGTKKINAYFYEFLGVAGANARQDLRNLSTRKKVENGGTLIAGFSHSGAVHKRFLIRAAGKSLDAFGVPNTMANPRLKVYDANGKLLEENDDWDPNHPLIRDATQRSGAFPLTSALDSVILITLREGSYTVQVEGADEARTGGDVLVEVYEVAGL